MQCCNICKEHCQYVYFHFIVCRTHLRRSQIEKVTIVRTPIGLHIGQYLARILGHKRPLGDFRQALDAKAFALRIALEHLKVKASAVLNDPVFAQQLVAATTLGAFEDHGWVLEVELFDEAAFEGVPVLDRDLAALTTLGDAAAKKTNLDQKSS
jgi:hypothetical protein